MNCYYHPGRPAVAQCPDCGKGLCRECASKFEKPICTACNDKRGKSAMVNYAKPLVVCAIFFLVGCLVGKSAGFGDAPAIMGYIFTCIYGGWSIVDMFLSNIFISLDIRSIVFYYGLKILLAVIIGIFATPIFLGYCIYKLIREALK
ncbi:MAG: hypothetical protein J6X71_03735 [Bacteroidales bacterium]|nr:hypothetical protein [Bacteroidales bacterium]